MSACLPLEHGLSSEQTPFDPWKAQLLASPNSSWERANKVLTCSVNSDQSITAKKRDYTLRMTSCHRGWKEISCLPRMQTFSKNAVGFLLGSTVTIFK